MTRFGLRLTPHGHLVFDTNGEATELEAALAARLAAAFGQGSGHGLWHLGAVEVGRELPPLFAWWRGFAGRYVAALCGDGAVAADATASRDVPAPSDSELATLVLTAPMMAGGEYLIADVLRALWTEIAGAASAAPVASGVELQSFLKALNPSWNLVGRVHFNLAENRRDAEAPFAFMATYTPLLSAQGRAQHLPLGQALREYAGKAHRSRLMALLLPVQRAAEACDWLRPMVEAGEIFHPLRWTPAEVARLLTSVAELEQAGVVVRMPAGWHRRRPARPSVQATVGTRAPPKLGLDGLLDFDLGRLADLPHSAQPLLDQRAASQFARYKGRSHSKVSSRRPGPLA